MKQANRVIKNTGILYLQMGLTMFASLYITRLILITLGDADYGIYNLILGSIGMLSFLNGAMTTASQRFMSFARGEKKVGKQKTIFNSSIILHIIVGVFFVILLEVLGFFLFDIIFKIPEDRVQIAKFTYQFLIINAFFTFISVPYTAVVNARENMLFEAILKIIQTILLLIATLYLTHQNYDKLLMYGFLITLITIILFFIRLIYCHLFYEEVVINFKKYKDKKIFKEMYTHAGWSLLGSTSSIITMQGTTLLLNNFFGVIVNAAQGITNQISGQLMTFSNAMLKSLNPVIVKNEGASDRKKMLLASITGNKLSFFLLSFFSIPILIEMPFILKFWLKQAPEYSVIFCRLTIVRLMFSQLSVTFPTAIGATNKIKRSQMVESIIYIALLPASYIMFKNNFSPQIIYINLIAMVLMLLLSRLYFTNKLCGLDIKYYSKNVISKCLIIAVVTIVISLIPIKYFDQSFFRLFLVAAISSIIFVTLFFIIGLSHLEKTALLQIKEKLKFLKKTI